VIGFILSLFVKETYCKPQKEMIYLDVNEGTEEEPEKAPS
jgi:hypothetical protein